MQFLYNAWSNYLGTLLGSITTNMRLATRPSYY